MTKRQQEIFNLLSDVDCTADVGCDHGIISLEILKQNKSKKVIATDISQKCLDKTINLLSNNGLTDRAEYYCTNGMPPIEVDQILIAGMGGLEIVDILSRYIKKNKPILLLQPMRDEDKVRQFLSQNGYKIIVDKVVFDKKFYCIIKAVEGKQNLTTQQIYFGAVPQFYKETDYKMWLKYIEEKYKKIIKKLDKNTQKYNLYTELLLNINNIKE